YQPDDRQVWVVAGAELSHLGQFGLFELEVTAPDFGGIWNLLRNRGSDLLGHGGLRREEVRRGPGGIDRQSSLPRHLQIRPFLLVRGRALYCLLLGHLSL